MFLYNSKILVVDNDRMSRLFTVNLLKSFGVKFVYEATDGEQALAMLQEHVANPVQLIICDLALPNLDGMELMRLADKNFEKIAFIVLSDVSKKVLNLVTLMCANYRLKLLGAMEKPLMMDKLKSNLTKLEPKVKVWNKPTQTVTFSLEEILKGIEQNEFVPYVQPQLDLKTSRIMSVEALARWQHPQHGLIAPYAFIPLLEQSEGEGMTQLTLSILQQTVKLCRQLFDQNKVLTFSVNISMSSLQQPNFAKTIIQIVRDGKVHPQQIMFEITESAAMSTSSIELENVARFIMNGFQLSIDDYGTGYSSMQQLANIPFNELKIDQSFVTGVAAREEMRIIVESSIEMARKLNVKCVAEGVETSEDLARLNSMGCDIAQGYYIAKPFAPDELTTFIDEFIPPPELNVADSILATKILVVEDNDFVRNMTIRVIENLGFLNVSGVQGPTAAMIEFEYHEYGLIITDVEMPDMNGLSFVKLIRSGKTLAKADTRVIMLTGLSEESVLAAALALDVNGYMVKPLVPAAVNERIAFAINEQFKPKKSLAYTRINTRIGEQKPIDDDGDSITTSKISEEEKVVSEEAVEIKERSLYLPLENLLAGMILNEDIVLKNGTVLLRTGFKLSENNINRLFDLVTVLKSSTVTVRAD